MYRNYWSRRSEIVELSTIVNKWSKTEMQRTINDIQELMSMIDDDYEKKSKPYIKAHEYALEICAAIRQEICSGKCQYDAIIDTSINFGYPLKDVFFAWKIRSYDDFCLRQLITNQLILLLKEMGFGARQIYNKIENYTPLPVMYRDILHRYADIERNNLPLFKNCNKKFKSIPTTTKRRGRPKKHEN